MRELVTLFQESDLTELSIEQAGRKLFLRKDVQASPPQEPQEDARETPATELETAIKAPLVGTFFWNREKSGKPSLAVHQQVEKGQIAGYIEALGIFNEVESPEAGEVVEIAVAAGEPVEYGQPLIVLKPHA